MRVVTDWHIHSKYSRACSKELELPTIAKWCDRKGIQVVATGDWTHPLWFAHLQESLIESEPGIFQLNDHSSPTRFMLAQEVSQIYKQGDKARRVHNLIFSPSIETCSRVIAWLQKNDFNLASDGRPILGINSETLYRELKAIDERIIMIPAHAWTPWYSVFGSKSGFDSLEECFGEMTPYIYAIETGLSSNPEMNWGLSSLDRVVCISNSDAHSPRNLGREANVFNLDTLSYDEFVRVIREQDTKRFLYTIEFFPEEGKYHFDGCALCQFSCNPTESKRLGNRCPTCGRALTLGVANRVRELTDRDPTAIASRKIPFRSIVPLAEILAEVVGVSSVSSKRVEELYMRMTDEIADEFTILLETPRDLIERVTKNLNVWVAIERVRLGFISIKPGYDGLYGDVSIFGEGGPPLPTQSTLRL